MNNAEYSNYENKVDEVTVDNESLDSVGDQEETTWENDKFSTYWGYFTHIPDLQSALLMKSVWNVGKGYKVDNRTQAILDNIVGWGKDTFQDILFNMDVMRNVAGDSFAEVVRNDKGTLINLKPLDPSTIKIVVNRQGQIIRYEQMTKSSDKGKGIHKKFKPEEIFHLSNNRMGDQIHGISKIEALEETIKADNESFVDIKKMMHHQVRPIIMWKLKTDDTTRINAFIAKVEKLRNRGAEDIFIPDDDNTVSYEVVQVNPSSLILEWRNDTRNKFYRSIGLPQIQAGAGGMSTESESKVIFRAYEQLVQAEQLYLEKQIWNQLALRIDLNHPESLSNELATDEAKDGAQAGLNPQPGDTRVGGVNG